jgi:hypothetical protein
VEGELLDASSSSASPNVAKPASPAHPDAPDTSHNTSPAPASLPAPKKTSSPAKDDPLQEQDNPAPEVHMDSGAQQDTSDTSAPASGARTTEDAGVGDTSAGIEKGKGPAVPEVRTTPAPVSTGQVTPAAPEQPAPKAPNPEQTAAPAKTGTFKIQQIIKTTASPATTTLASTKTAPSSSAMTLHYGKTAARPSFFQTPKLEGRVSLLTKSDKSLGSLKEHFMKWSDADYMDSAGSKKKKLPGVPLPILKL